MAQDYDPLNSRQDDASAVNEEADRSQESCSRGHGRPRQPLPVRPAMILKDIVLAILALSGLLAIFKSQMIPLCRQQPEQNQHLPSRKSCKCGDTVAEAVDNGCRFDSMAVAWLPDHCRDDELTGEFERSGDGPDGRWTYWKDGERTEEISIEEISRNADNDTFRIYMTPDWHVVHCLFYWRREHIFKVVEKTLDPRFDTEDHIKHCTSVIRNNHWKGSVASVSTNADVP
ncbi:hypothetical protein GGR54DRAFT_70986 [Hypoxylon sp. NC1633]|nr:hypothetical protein GGR54DRAFT_70986 [Hypoxylon sp. NC1633]